MASVNNPNQEKGQVIQKVKIVPYQEKYHEHFKGFNQKWIEEHFEMEDSDNKALDSPKEYILDKGGHILVALYENEPVGVCALIKMNDLAWDFELAKMAVFSEVQGLGIGNILANAVIAKAKSLGAKSIYLESNTVLAPAIKLYKKLGFEEISGYETPYQRCNIQMMLKLK
jgi:GNAT superfamily N-acetyltransferase